MFGLKRKVDLSKNGLTPCLSGLSLFESNSLKQYLLEIKNLVSCPQDIYQTLYLSTLYRLAEFCQAMPFSEKTFLQTYGLIERQLKLAIAALKLRRGLFFPKNSGAETIAAEEAQWTYALFSASLLRDIHQVQCDRKITLHDENREQIGPWSALSGSLYEKNRYYSITFSSKISGENRGVFMAAISGRIIPPMAFRWLAENKALFSLWWSTILHDSSQPQEIAKIIEDSAQKLGIILLNDDPIQCQNESNENALIEHFTGWIIQLSKYNPDSIFRTQKGVFVSEHIIDDFIGQESILSKSVFIQQLEKAHGLELVNDAPYHLLSPKKFEDRRVLRGIILNSSFVPEILQGLPINTTFQDHITL